MPTNNPPIRVYQTDADRVYVPSIVVYAEWDATFQTYLFPAGCRTEPPPEVAEHQVARSVGEGLGSAWEVVPDYRGFVYWTPDRQRHVIKEYGVVPPEGHLLEDPGPTAQERAAYELSATQEVVMACYEAGIPFPGDWRAYRAALRIIVAGADSNAALPQRPALPEGI